MLTQSHTNTIRWSWDTHHCVVTDRALGRQRPQLVVADDCLHYSSRFITSSSAAFSLPLSQSSNALYAPMSRLSACRLHGRHSPPWATSEIHFCPLRSSRARELSQEDREASTCGLIAEQRNYGHQRNCSSTSWKKKAFHFATVWRVVSYNRNFARQRLPIPNTETNKNGNEEPLDLGYLLQSEKKERKRWLHRP